MAKLKAPAKAKASVGTPKRRNNQRIWDGSWKVPSEWTSSTGKHKSERVTHVEYKWVVNRVSSPKLKGDPYEKSSKHGVSKKSDNFDLTFTYKGKSYTRQSFYPYTKTKIKDIVLQVRLWNEGGHGPWCSSSSADFQVPRQPEITAIALNSSTGEVNFTITSNYGNNQKERAYTEYWVDRYDSRTGKTTRVLPGGGGTKKSTSLSIQDKYDVTDWAQLQYNEYVRITLYAINKGLAGDSGKEPVHRQITFGYPGQAKINKVECHGYNDPDKVTISIDTGATPEHPVTQCKLQALVDSDYADASDIPAGDWDGTETGAVDDGECKAFASTVGQLRPVKGKHTWLRVVTVNRYEQPYVRYSNAVEVSQLYKAMPTAADDRCGIISATPSVDGTSADILVGWTDVGGANTGTELSWSEDQNAWKSTNPPNTFEFEWTDGNAPVGSGWTKASTIHLMDLTPGEVTYVRARRYLVNADDSSLVTYSPYCEAAAVMAVSGPTSVIMSASSYVPRGQGIEVTWGYNSDAEQSAWRVRRQVGADRDESVDLVLASGEDQRTSVVIPTDGITEEYVVLYVEVDTGGTMIASEASRTVYLNDPPTLTIVAANMEGPSYSFDLTTDIPNASAKVEVTSEGVSDDEFHERQVNGDTVWSDVIDEPEWALDGQAYTASVGIPDGQDFRDGCNYVIRASVTDPRTGLSSEEVSADFKVEWEHQAPKPPEDGIVITPSDTTDENGVRVRQCVIALTPPDLAESGDLYDVYRLTPDGQYLIYSGAALDAVVTDAYAPFGGTDMAYRVACRTAEGDTDFTDYAYELDERGATDPMEMRIDFGTEYVEFERGVALSNKWAKGFRQHSGLDGSMPGMWGPNVTRTMSSSPVFVRIYDNDKDVALRALGQYKGACFVRTSDGSAFCANVEVGHSTSVGSAGVVAQLNVTEIDLTSEYMATVPTAEEVQQA